MEDVFYIKKLQRIQNRRYLISILFITVTAVIYYQLVYKDWDTRAYFIPDLDKAIRVLEQRLHENVLLNKGKGCEMPNLDPFDKEAMKFWSKPEKITCDGIDWVECYLTKCWVVQKILDKYNDIICLYEDIIYVHDHSHYIAEPVIVNGSDVYILNRSDHVRVKCSAKKVGFSSISPEWIGYKAGLRPLPLKPSPAGRETGLNVLMLCFDSTAHNNFRRTMPKSYQVLTEELQAIALNSYNIVGDATVAAMFPVMTGKSELELPDTRKTMSSRKLDPKWLIFHLLHQDGYRTAYFEDTPWGGTFQYRHNGFPYQPADHYLRAFFLEEFRKSRKISYNGYKDSYCIGDVPQYKLMLNLTDQFLRLDGKKFCFTFIADICHDDINLIGTADDEVADFLRTFKAQGRLEDTLLIVMGDHGSRLHKIRAIYQGRIEERLPLMTIVLPQKFKQKRPNAQSILRSNVNILTTPFDIHTTLLDYVGLKQYRNSYIIPGSEIERGLSLLDSIPNTRTCSEAGVMVHWCACSNWVTVPKDDKMYQLVPNILAEFINNITKEKSSQCAVRTLVHIEWVIKQINNEAVLRFGVDKEKDIYLGNPIGPRLLPTSEYYQAKIIMDPGKAHYEGSVRYRVKHDYFIVSERDISRTNAYGQQPACVSDTHPHLNKYCYCKDYSP